MGIDLFAFDHECNVTELTLVKEVKEVTLLSLFHEGSRLADHRVFCDAAQATCHQHSVNLALILVQNRWNLIIWVCLHLSKVVGLGVLTLSWTFLVCLTWLSIDVLVIVPTHLLLVNLEAIVAVWRVRRIARRVFGHLTITVLILHQVDNNRILKSVLESFRIHDQCFSIRQEHQARGIDCTVVWACSWATSSLFNLVTSLVYPVLNGSNLSCVGTNNRVSSWFFWTLWHLLRCSCSSALLTSSHCLLVAIISFLSVIDSDRVILVWLSLIVLETWRVLDAETSRVAVHEGCHLVLEERFGCFNHIRKIVMVG